MKYELDFGYGICHMNEGPVKISMELSERKIWF